jgi:hypothetical protein
MKQTCFAVCDRSTNSLVRNTFEMLPRRERERISSVITAVTDKSLPTAVRPFMFQGKTVHELYFDSEKMLFFTKMEKIGCTLSAMIIACLASEKKLPLSDQALMEHSGLITKYAKRLNHSHEVSAFIARLKMLEDGWKKEQDDL